MVGGTIFGIGLLLSALVSFAGALKLGHLTSERKNPLAREFTLFFGFLTAFLVLRGAGELTAHKLLVGWGYITGSIALWMALAVLAQAGSRISFQRMGRYLFLVILTLGSLITLQSFLVFTDSLAHSMDTIVFTNARLTGWILILVFAVVSLVSAFFIYEILTNPNARHKLASLFVVIGVWFTGFAWALWTVITEPAPMLAIVPISVVGLFALFVGAYSHASSFRNKAQK